MQITLAKKGQMVTGLIGIVIVLIVIIAIAVPFMYNFTKSVDGTVADKFTLLTLLKTV